MRFCNPFDEALAHAGPPAVFLPDPDGYWRFDASWTRDAWQRLDPEAPRPAPGAWRYVLLRDRATGFVQLALATGPALLGAHPRADVRPFETLEAAEAARGAFGRPPVAREAW